MGLIHIWQNILIEFHNENLSNLAAVSAAVLTHSITKNKVVRILGTLLISIGLIVAYPFIINTTVVHHIREARLMHLLPVKSTGGRHGRA
jgi:hypothetical protein